jgi:5-methylcytosine-specific restriction endonuclease McrA
MGARLKSRSARFRRGLLHSVQQGLCGICGRKLYGTKGTSLDHVLPLSRGGGNEGNLLLAHKRCNGAKGSRLPTGCELIFLDIVNIKLAQFREVCP